MNEDYYILVQWPESQDFIGVEGAYFCDHEDLGSSAYFVRKDVYDKVMNEKSVEENDRT